MPRHTHTTPAPRAMRGFTLVELMITIFIAAILLVLAVPSFRGVISRTNLASVNDGLTSALHYARTEAVTRGVHVAVSASSGSNGWADGWSVVALAPDPANNETLREQEALKPRYKIDATPTEVKFGPQGTADTDACFTVKDEEAGSESKPKYLRVLRSGSIHSTDSCS